MQLDESIRAELEVTCSTRPDNPFPVSKEVTTRTDSRHFDSPAERRLFEDVAGVSGNRWIKHGSSVSNEVTTRTDSRHFDSPAERRLFEDVAGVSGNRCIKHGSSSTVVDWQTTVGVFFQDPDISENIFRFPASPAINDTLSAYRPTSGTGILNSVEIRCAVPEIFARERKRVRSAGKWRRHGRSQEDDHSLTFDSNEFGVREPNSAEIGLTVFEKRSNRRTQRQTDTQTDTSSLCI